MPEAIPTASEYGRCPHFHKHMKFIHTADWRLGQTFYGHDRTAEHRHFLNWLLATLRERQPDALIVAGNVFDSPSPTAQAEALYFEFLRQAVEEVPGLQVVVVAGRHDAPERIEAAAGLLRAHNIYVRGTLRRDPATNEPDYDYHLLPLAPRGQEEATCVCLALPCLRCGDRPPGLSAGEALAWHASRLHHAVRKSDFRKLPLVTAAHFPASGATLCPADTDGYGFGYEATLCDPGLVGRDMSYTALGGLGKAQQVGGAPNAFYAGQVLPYDFGTDDFRPGVQWVDLDAEGHAAVSRISYTPLRSQLTIPGEGGTPSPSQVLRELAALPRRRKDDTPATWPYAEVTVEAGAGSEAETLRLIEEEAARRAVLLCRTRPAADRDSGKLSAATAPAPRRDMTGNPLHVAQRIYQAQCGEEMPEALAQLFRQAASAAATSEA